MTASGAAGPGARPAPAWRGGPERAGREEAGGAIRGPRGGRGARDEGRAALRSAGLRGGAPGTPSGARAPKWARDWGIRMIWPRAALAPLGGPYR